MSWLAGLIYHTSTVVIDMSGLCELKNMLTQGKQNQMNKSGDILIIQNTVAKPGRQTIHGHGHSDHMHTVIFHSFMASEGAAHLQMFKVTKNLFLQVVLVLQ